MSYSEDVASRFAPAVTGPAVDYLRALAEGGSAFEFAVGTELLTYAADP